jgi:hypothetical protein
MIMKWKEETEQQKDDYPSKSTLGSFTAKTTSALESLCLGRGVESNIINGVKMDNKGRSIKHKHRKHSVKTSFDSESFTKLLHTQPPTPKPNSDFP